MTRILAMSDLHVDFKDNMRHMLSLSDSDYKDDCLIVAGDACDDITKLEQLLSSLTSKFSHVSFVPGNHELWVRRSEFADSLEKFNKIMALCDDMGVHSRPFKVGSSASQVTVVPLFSWYRTDDSDPHSLKITKVGEDWENSPWADKYYCKWSAEWQADPALAANYFAKLNVANIRQYDTPVISVSHFLPRRELIFNEQQHVDRFCRNNAVIPAFDSDPAPSFNFSRVAGCSLIDQQIRSLGSTMHVYGHQHRNRNRIIDGVHYVSHCLGYARERSILGHNSEPRVIWQDGDFIQPDQPA
ncbi:MAG: metallophosphoesterase [Pseudomonadales bacterium]